MRVEVGLVVAGVILIVAAAALAWRRLRPLRDQASVEGNDRSTGRDMALVIGAFCAIVVVVTVTALQLR